MSESATHDGRITGLMAVIPRFSSIGEFTRVPPSLGWTAPSPGHLTEPPFCGSDPRWAREVGTPEVGDTGQTDVVRTKVPIVAIERRPSDALSVEAEIVYGAQVPIVTRGSGQRRVHAHAANTCILGAIVVVFTLPYARGARVARPRLDRTRTGTGLGRREKSQAQHEREPRASSRKGRLCMHRPHGSRRVLHYGQGLIPFAFQCGASAPARA